MTGVIFCQNLSLFCAPPEQPFQYDDFWYTLLFPLRRHEQ